MEASVYSSQSFIVDLRGYLYKTSRRDPPMLIHDGSAYDCHGETTSLDGADAAGDESDTDRRDDTMRLPRLCL